MDNTTYIYLKDLPAPVELRGCTELLAFFSEILTFWPVELRKTKTSEIEPFFVISPDNSGYSVSSPYFDAPRSYRDAVNTLCALVAELAWEQLRNDASLLCIHAAAIEVRGRLVVIPNKRRAGKSTLTAALAARGYRVFTDDFLPLGINEQQQLCGISSGIAPRLRLPLPAGFGEQNTRFVENNAGPFNPQYKYLKLGQNSLAGKNDMLPIGGIMVLNRDDDNPLLMSQPETSDILRTLITQNFAREMKSSGILRSLEFLVSHARCYELSYANVDQALDLIDQTFLAWDTPVSTFETGVSMSDFGKAPLGTAPRSSVNITDDTLLQHADGVTIRDMGKGKFLSDQNGMAIHQLNETSAAIWQVLKEPSNVAQIAEIFQQAFPDANPESMTSDIRKTVQKMAKAGLVQPPL